MAIESKKIETAKAEKKVEAKQERKQVKAFARYIQISPQKMRLVADLVRSRPVEYALEQLRFSSKNAAVPLAKAINSAVANAVHNFNIKKEDLFIKTLTIDGGPVLHRYKPRAQGQASAIHKRSSHINVVLEERKHVARKTSRSFFAGTKTAKKEEPKKHDHDHEHAEAVATDAKKPKLAPKSEEKQKGNKVTLKRRLFNRKSGE